jgi:uncharacterized membrane protein
MKNNVIGYIAIALVLMIFGAVALWFGQRFNHPKDLASYPRESLTVGRVIQIQSETIIQQELVPYLQQNVTVETFSRQQETVGYTAPAVEQSRLHPGDKVLIGQIIDDYGTYNYVIDVWRIDVVAIVTGIFLLLVFFVLGKSGMRSLIGIGISYYIIIWFLVPFIAQGYSPIIITMISLLLLVPTSFFIVHGFYLKTAISVIATLASLLITGLLAYWVIGAGKLTGMTEDSMIPLLASNQNSYSFSGLLVSGMIIAALGILDDVTISQASLTQELYQTGTKKSVKQLFSSAMRVGRDHIASMINTLLLVYAGAMLPTLLLFSMFPRPIMTILTNEFLVQEYVAGMIGSIGLILAVPATTYLMAYSLFHTKKST